MLPVHISVNFVGKDCTDNERNINTKLNPQPRILYRYFEQIFTKWVRNTVYVPINKTLIYFQNIIHFG